MRPFFWKLISDKSGVTAIEYGLIAALIAVAAISIMGMLGTNLSGGATAPSDPSEIGAGVLRPNRQHQTPRVGRGFLC